MDKRDFNGFKPIGKYVSGLVRPFFNEKTSLITRLASDWHFIVGGDVAEKTKPVKITFSRGNKDEGGALLINIDSGFATEFSHREGEMIERIATYFGYKLVKSIKLKQIPVGYETESPTTPVANKDIKLEEKQAIENMLADIGDDELHSALKSFLTSAYKSK